MVTLIELIGSYFSGEHRHGYDFVTFVNRRLPVDGVFVSTNQSVEELTEPRPTRYNLRSKPIAVYEITGLNFSSVLTAPPVYYFSLLIVTKTNVYISSVNDPIK